VKLFNKQYSAPGSIPGCLLQAQVGKFELILNDYNAIELVEKRDLAPEQCQDYLTDANVTWIHVQGDPTPEALGSLGSAFGLHSLHLEDIINTGQRPKLDVNDNQIFVILSLPIIKADCVVVEQISLFLSERTVISFCTGELNPFDLIFERLHQTIGKLRKKGAGYLFYTLIDAVIDHGFPILEAYAERIEAIEEILLDKPNQSTLQQVHRLRRELLLLRRRLWPQREVINELVRDVEVDLIGEGTQMYLRDCYDHVIAILELLETYREMTASMLEVYLSSLSHKLNEVMRVLTVIATLFIPPTFVVGLYGMNFDRNVSSLNMPELSWPYGYLLVWLVIVVMISGMLIYFRRKHWF
jgi:magnesium transporter